MDNLQLLYEDWRYVPGFEGIYLISNRGRIQSLPRNFSDTIGRQWKVKGRALRTKTDKNGYVKITLCKNLTLITKTVHRLVALAFIPNPLNLKEVNHIDGDKSNNCNYNLEWSSRSGNIKHAFDKGLKKPSQPYSITPLIKHSSSKPIYQLDKDGGIIKEWTSAFRCAKELNIIGTNITACLKGKQTHVKGYRFKYVE